MLSIVLLFFVLASAHGRAVNISNTWVLPEEGFPVFYRYFRDRISWYEADAVCQFHHANLVTVDTTAQYDAVRAYLKELDISSAVWVGLIRSNPDGDFTWTDYRGLGSDGYWSSAPDSRAAPLCAAADPVADYRWKAQACGGPTVASFICELPVPQWALGNEGCMVKALPALTILYLPESAAVQLTADCGLAGVKRVQCTGNVKRAELLKELSCAEENEPTSTPGEVITAATSIIAAEITFSDQDAISDMTTTDNVTTEHEDDINQSSTIKPVIPYKLHPSLIEKTNKHIEQILANKAIDLGAALNNNLQSNDIPKIVSNENLLSSDISNKLEDEKHMRYKILHDEIARHGNIETIFTQPTDHFVPPLVMAKAKISDDMTVLSIEEKQAQQFAEQRFLKQSHENNDNIQLQSNTNLADVLKSSSTEKSLIVTTISNDVKKDVVKSVVPKKYIEKQYGFKNKVVQKETKIEKSTESYSTSSKHHFSNLETTTTTYAPTTINNIKVEDEPTVDLTVIIREPNTQGNRGNISEISKLEINENGTSKKQPEIKLSSSEGTDGEITQQISVKLPAFYGNNLTMSHEVIKITILNEEDKSASPKVFEVTTRMPVFESTSQEIENTSDLHSQTTLQANMKPDETVTLGDLIANKSKTVNVLQEKIGENYTEIDYVLTTTDFPFEIVSVNENSTDFITDKNITDTTILPHEMYNLENDTYENQERNMNDSSSEIDDFQSPLLSGANEPVHRPNRSRRPQQPNRINKFNPFRILG